MTAQRIKKLTVEEYVELERTTGIKHEYHNGEVFAMAGGTFNHSILCGRIFGELRDRLLSINKDCEAFTSEMKLNLDDYNSYVYPDAMVVCGDFKQPVDFEDAITNPILIVEVLSDSTESYDRGEKFQKYQSIQSFTEYVLIAQNQPKVEVFYRAENINNWQINYYEGLDKIVHLQSLQIDIEMKAIYERVVFKTYSDKINI